MEKLDWTSFTTRISINSPKSKIFEYWTIQDNIEKWFLSKADFFRGKQQKDRLLSMEKGDSFIWMWHGSEVVEKGEVLENNGVDFIKFTFAGCIVSVKLKTEEGEHVVELIQSAIPLDDTSRMNYFVGCSTGWTFYLANLKSILEGGIDLRNRNKKLVNVINT